MKKRLAYVDQNVVGMLAQGKISLPRLPELCWVYSKEHFAEIRRCSDPKPFLSALEGIDAKLLDTELDSNWKISGSAQLIEHGGVAQHYASYLEAVKGYDSYANLFDPLLAWLNGGSDEGPFKELPDRLAEDMGAFCSAIVSHDKRLIGRQGLFTTIKVLLPFPCWSNRSSSGNRMGPAIHKFATCSGNPPLGP